MIAQPKAIIMDVDTGVDDALAIILAHRAPGAEVVAIGTVSGNVSAAQAATNTLKTLDALGASTPVAVGAPHALATNTSLPAQSTAATAWATRDCPRRHARPLASMPLTSSCASSMSARASYRFSPAARSPTWRWPSNATRSYRISCAR